MFPNYLSPAVHSYSPRPFAFIFPSHSRLHLFHTLLTVGPPNEVCFAEEERNSPLGRI